MFKSRKIFFPSFFVFLLIFISGCSKHQPVNGKSVGVNFRPNTYIDSLYAAYIDSEGVKQISCANNLLAALYEDETTDSLLQFSSQDDRKLVDATANYWMGEYFYATSRFNEAENAGLLALENVGETKDDPLAMDIISLLGATCHRLGKFQDALNYMQKCYMSSIQSGDLEMQSSDLNNMAAIAQSLRKSDLAKSYIDKAIEIETTLGRDNVLAIRYGTASEIYLSLGELETAEKFARDAYDLDVKGGRDGKAAIRLSQLANVLIAKGDKQQAIQILTQAEAPLEASGNNLSLGIVENQLGSLYLERGENTQAANHFKKAYAASKNSGNLRFLQDALTGLANSLKDTNLPEAYDYLKMSAEIADSIYRLNSKNEIAEIEQKYIESETLRESESRAYESKIQNYILLIVLSISIFAISLLFFIIRNKNRKQLMLKSLASMRSNFFTNITHEFRTPLTVIMGLCNNLSRSDSTDEVVKATADAITMQSKDLLDLVNQLLDISKVQSEIGTPDWHHGNVVSYMHMIAEKYVQTASQKGVDLLFSPSENVVNMDFIPQYMNKILHNLISNSLKFTHKGDKIIISTNVADGKLVLRFADTGLGIDHAKLSHIFEPYYQGDNNLETGTGIGLSLVSQMVKAMDGEISVKSLKGKGTMFTILLPLEHVGEVKALGEETRLDSNSIEVALTEKPADADTDTGTISDDDASPKPIALIVEDHTRLASYIGGQLSQYNVHYARNGREGLAKTKELIPDVIVTDLMMPVMDGMSMIQEIKADITVNHIPILVITAKADESEKIRALNAGVDAYLVKPFNQGELEARISQLIKQRQMLCERYQLALNADNTENDDMSAADRQFISNVVGVVYSMISKEESTDLEAVANKVNMTGRSFSRKLQALTGDAPMLYINKIKVSKAKTMLDSDPKISLSDVAYQCGFDSLSYFSRTFKQIEGINPTSYRRRVK